MLAFGLINCSKSCEVTINACNDTPPTDEVCAAAFSRWFYNKDQNKCELIGYSGCSLKGFETEKACKVCRCK